MTQAELEYRVVCQILKRNLENRLEYLENRQNEDGVIAGEIIFKSDIKVARGYPVPCFYQTYFLVDHLAKRLRKTEYTYRLVVFDDAIKSIQLNEGEYYMITNFSKIRNAGVNLRDGQSEFEYFLYENTYIKSMF